MPATALAIYKEIEQSHCFTTLLKILSNKSNWTFFEGKHLSLLLRRWAESWKSADLPEKNLIIEHFNQKTFGRLITACMQKINTCDSKDLANIVNAIVTFDIDIDIEKIKTIQRQCLITIIKLLNKEPQHLNAFHVSYFSNLLAVMTKLQINTPNAIQCLTHIFILLNKEPAHLKQCSNQDLANIAHAIHSFNIVNLDAMQCLENIAALFPAQTDRFNECTTENCAHLSAAFTILQMHNNLRMNNLLKELIEYPAAPLNVSQLFTVSQAVFFMYMQSHYGLDKPLVVSHLNNTQTPHSGIWRTPSLSRS